MRATSRHIGALVLWFAPCAWLAACAAESPEPPPFGEALEDEVSVGPTTVNAAGPTTTVNSTAAANTTGGTSGGVTSAASGGTTGGQTTANPLGGTQTSTVTSGGMAAGPMTSGATTGGGPTSGGPTTGGGFTNAGATNGGAAANTGGGNCTNVRPTGTDWDEATCDQWASETNECAMDWMVDNNYCNESCGRC